MSQVRLPRVVLFFVALLSPSLAPRGYAATSLALAQQAPPASKITKYTLPPDRYKKARNFGKIHFRFELISFVYGLLVLWLILRWKLSAKYRTLAENKSPKGKWIPV